MKYFIAFLIIVLMALGAYMTFTRNVSAPEEEEQTPLREIYMSDTYGFSFTVPEGYTFHEYTQESISVGNPLDDGFLSVADVRLYAAGEDVAFGSYDAFITQTLKNMCAADGPNETIYCTDVTDRQPFAASTGLQGEVLYLDRIHEDRATGAQKMDRFGPVFVFNIQANVPQSDFAALAVQPPANLSATDVQSALVRSVADSVNIEAQDDAWVTTEDSGAVFEYPAALPTFYTEAVDWPPSVQVLDEPYSCTEAGSITDRTGATAERTYDGTPYCVTEVVEGAAGSIYTQYAYLFAKEDKTIALTFSTRTVQCGNFDEVQRASCELERNTNDIDSIVHEIAQTLRLQ